MADASLDRRDLIVLALPGVQRFIAESRSTADVRGASEIVAALASRLAAECQAAGAELVFPSDAPGQSSSAGKYGISSDSGRGMPNRVVALAQAETGTVVAKQAAAAGLALWQRWVRLALKLPAHSQAPATPPTPGFPLVQWACVPDMPGGYAEQWRQANDLLAARRRVRDFTAWQWTRRDLCALSPRWPAEPAPAGLKPHEQATLSSANWVKRRWRHIQHLNGFASTASIASAGFRRAVLDRMHNDDVRNAVRELMGLARQAIEAEETPVAGLSAAGGSGEEARWLRSSGGPWVYPDRWQAHALARDTGLSRLEAEVLANRGQKAARELIRIMKNPPHRIAAPTRYLAVIVQDLDGMGAFLSGEGRNAAGQAITVSPHMHQEISGSLRALADRQWRTLEDPRMLGVPVYAGGDDLMGFTPAATALTAAEACHDHIPPSLPAASTAVMFFHHHAGLREALAVARRLLDEAKELVPGKHALGVGYLRRSGVSAVSIQPWSGPDGQSAATLYRLFAADREHPLSPRLVADLERDGDELGRLHRRSPPTYRAELGRLVGRHIGGDRRTRPKSAAKAAAALEWLGAMEAAPNPDGNDRVRPVHAARVGVFLRQEAR